MPNDYVQASELSSLIQGFELDDTPGQGVMTTAQADTVIQLIEGELNGIISSLGFQVPLTDAASPHAYKYMRSIAVQGVMALLQAAIHALTDDTEGSREQAFWRRYEMAVKRLNETGGAALVDALPVVGDLSGNVPPALGDQPDNVDRYVGLRDLTNIRKLDNDWAYSRLYRNRGKTRFFEGGAAPR
jgi:hypothetical protein